MSDHADRESDQRQRRLAALYQRLDGLLPADPGAAAGDVAMLAYYIVANSFPATLSAEQRRQIKDNYPDATDRLIAERALGEQGLAIMIGLGTMLTQIAVDYSPLSHCKPLMDADGKLPASVGPRVSQQINASMVHAQAAGMTAFGAACTAILSAVSHAKSQAVPPMLLIRPLLDAIAYTFRDAAPMDAAAAEEHLITMMMQTMQVSRATAKRYVAMAKQRISDQD